MSALTDKIVFLGTSGASPSEEASLPAVLVHLNGNYYLFDCGEDLQRNFVKSGAKLNKPTAVFVTHRHADHVIGLPGFIFRLALNERSEPLKIVGPPGLIEYAGCHFRTVGLQPPFHLVVTEIHPSEDDVVGGRLVRYERPGPDKQVVESLPISGRTVFENSDAIVRASLGKHSVVNFQFALVQKPRPGKFHPEVARELGVPEGRSWKHLQEGRRIKLGGGEIDPIALGIVEPPVRGKVVVYTGDTRPHPEGIARLLEDLPFPVHYGEIDVLVHEAMYSTQHARQAEQKGHTTAAEAVEVVKRLEDLGVRVKKLVLTHVSTRYKDRSELLEEARKKAGSINVQIASDLLQLPF
ncbi:MAG: ribonuclease Z [Promethearchaeota archaeon]